MLLIMNVVGPAYGQLDGYRILQNRGEIGEVSAVSWRDGYERSPNRAADRVVAAVRSHRPDIVVIWSPGNFPDTHSQFDMIQEALGSASLVYWEGDGWGPRKPISPAMRWWLRRSQVVFSPAGPPQSSALLAAGASEVRHIPQTYCHIRFAACESLAPPPVSSRRVTMIGNNLMRIPAPGFAGLPGSARRAELAWRLRLSVDDFDLRGNGWARLGLAGTSLAYAQQANHLRQGALSVAWDHFPDYQDSSSDRLPIALISGRAHLTTRHPGMFWAPADEQGLIRRESPSAIVNEVTTLLENPQRLTALGQEAHRWARNRVSHREAARYIMSCVVESVRPAPPDPWDNLPGPWTR